MVDFIGKIAVVTGASKGIGTAVAIALSKAGATVVLASRLEKNLKDVAKKCNAEKNHTLAVPTDVTVPESVAHLMEITCKKFGQIDIIINCAGTIGPITWLEEIDIEDWKATLNTNLTGTFLTCHYVIPIMKKQQRGKIINVSSAAALDTPSGFAAYNASKAAVIALTKTLAKELHSFGIQVNTLCPGPVGTAMVDEIVNKKVKEGTIANIDLFRQLKNKGLLWTPEEVTELFLFLASDESKLVTGQFIQNTWKEAG